MEGVQSLTEGGSRGDRGRGLGSRGGSETGGDHATDRRTVELDFDRFLDLHLGEENGARSAACR
jgi:hypothetical protein